MIRLLIFFAIVFAAALGYSWLADQQGNVLLNINDKPYEVSLIVAFSALFAFAVAVTLLWIVVATIWKSPSMIGGFFSRRRREKGWQALASGMIAVSSGDIKAAKRAARDSRKLLPEEPVTRLLQAKSAELQGDANQARDVYEEMLEVPETKLLGLHGLYLEASKQDAPEAARHFAEKATETAPGISWAGTALLEMQVANGEWADALLTLHQNADSGMIDKKAAKRQRAVILTAHAADLEDEDPAKAKERALEAHRLAPDLVPAAVLAGRILSRLGEVRRATKVLETSWKKEAHPEIADVYVNVRIGDSGAEKLKRAKALLKLQPESTESAFAVARAEKELRNYDKARALISDLAQKGASERACLLMAEIDDADYGERSRSREWLSRAVTAERDAVWTADGYISENWAPVSPVTGKLDAFEWKKPIEHVGEREEIALERIPAGPRESEADAPTIEIQPKLEDKTSQPSTDEKTISKAVVAEEIAEVADSSPSDGNADSKVAESEKPAEEIETTEVVETKATDEKTTDTVEAKDVSKEPVISKEPAEEPKDVKEDVQKKPEAAASEIKADVILDDPGEKKTADAEMSTDIDDVDPINRPRLDDPGPLPVESEADKRKRFRLF